MDDLGFLTSDFFCDETREYFSRLKRKLELEEEYVAFLQQKRIKLVAQAIELGLVDELQAEFLDTETIQELIRDYKYYSANPAE